MSSTSQPPRKKQKRGTPDGAVVAAGGGSMESSPHRTGIDDLPNEILWEIVMRYYCLLPDNEDKDDYDSAKIPRDRPLLAPIHQTHRYRQTRLLLPDDCVNYVRAHLSIAMGVCWRWRTLALEECQRRNMVPVGPIEGSKGLLRIPPPNLIYVLKECAFYGYSNFLSRIRRRLARCDPDEDVYGTRYDCVKDPGFYINFLIGEQIEALKQFAAPLLLRNTQGAFIHGNVILETLVKATDKVGSLPALQWLMENYGGISGCMSPIVGLLNNTATTMWHYVFLGHLGIARWWLPTQIQDHDPVALGATPGRMCKVVEMGRVDLFRFCIEEVCRIEPWEGEIKKLSRMLYPKDEMCNDLLKELIHRAVRSGSAAMMEAIDALGTLPPREEEDDDGGLNPLPMHVRWEIYIEDHFGDRGANMRYADYNAYLKKGASVEAIEFLMRKAVPHTVSTMMIYFIRKVIESGDPEAIAALPNRLATLMRIDPSDPDNWWGGGDLMGGIAINLVDNGRTKMIWVAALSTLSVEVLRAVDKLFPSRLPFPKNAVKMIWRTGCICKAERVPYHARHFPLNVVQWIMARYRRENDPDSPTNNRGDRGDDTKPHWASWTGVKRNFVCKLMKHAMHMFVADGDRTAVMKYLRDYHGLQGFVPGEELMGLAIERSDVQMLDELSKFAPVRVVDAFPLRMAFRGAPKLKVLEWLEAKKMKRLGMALAHTDVTTGLDPVTRYWYLEYIKREGKRQERRITAYW